MRTRTITTLLALLVVVALVATAPAAVAFANDDDDGGAENESDGEAIAPGERLAGVVSVQDAEFDGEIDERVFELKVANASSDEAKAAVVADGLVDVDQRLDELEERAAELERAREAGNISEGRYKAEMAKIAAEKETAKRLAERGNATAQQLPDDVVADALESKGINASAIQTLKDRADELGGQEVRDIARSIGGPDVGKGMGNGAPDGVPANAGGPDETPGGANASDDSTAGDESSADTDRSTDADDDEASADDGDDRDSDADDTKSERDAGQ